MLKRERKYEERTQRIQRFFTAKFRESFIGIESDSITNAIVCVRGYGPRDRLCLLREKFHERDQLSWTVDIALMLDLVRPGFIFYLQQR